MKQAILRTLGQAGGGLVSGAELAQAARVSRNAIWKHVETLRELGYDIEAAPRLGYRLLQRPDRLYTWEIDDRLKTKTFGRQIEYHDLIDSTNTRAKQLAAAGCGEGQIVVAEGQTAGRGRLGRSWLSPRGEGIYVSLVLRPPLAPYAVPKLTLVAAVAVQRAIAQVCGIQTGIKWPNDLEADGKKVCGILVELSTEIDAVNYVVVGVGLNVNTDMADVPDEIAVRATSLRAVTGTKVERSALLAAYLDYMEQLYEQALTYGFETAIELNRRLSSTLGRPVVVFDATGPWNAVAVDIGDNGALVVEKPNGSRVQVHSGEVSIRAR